jgi:hypothetical protein
VFSCHEFEKEERKSRQHRAFAVRFIKSAFAAGANIPALTYLLMLKKNTFAIKARLYSSI